MRCFVCNDPGHDSVLGKCPRCHKPDDPSERVAAGLPAYVGPICPVLNYCWGCLKTDEWDREYAAELTRFWTRAKNE